MIERYDQSTMTDEQLLAEAVKIHEHANEPYIVGERRRDLERQLAHYAFEIAWRSGVNLADVPILQKNDAL